MLYASSFIPTRNTHAQARHVKVGCIRFATDEKYNGHIYSSGFGPCTAVVFICEEKSASATAQKRIYPGIFHASHHEIQRPLDVDAFQKHKKHIQQILILPKPEKLSRGNFHKFRMLFQYFSKQMPKTTIIKLCEVPQGYYTVFVKDNHVFISKNTVISYRASYKVQSGVTSTPPSDEQKVTILSAGEMMPLTQSVPDAPPVIVKVPTPVNLLSREPSSKS